MNGGLRLGVSVRSGNLPPTAVEFDVALQNVGDNDFVVNLGFMLANGRVMFPRAIRLLLTDPAGATRELDFVDRRFAVVAGRLDEFTVALRTGSIYVLRMRLDQYVSPATKEFALKLADGRHRIVARFEGQGATIGNLDMPGLAFMNFWKGTVQSNSVEFEASPNTVPK